VFANHGANMNKRVFIGFLVAIFALLAGWIFYISNQSRQPVPIQKITMDWWGSGHADSKALAFTNWDADTPPQVPVSCAKCHSGNGFLDYIGQDGSTPMVVDQPAAVDSVVSCDVCHNEKANALNLVEFPSGAQANFNHGNASCGTCHSGLDSGSKIDITTSGYSGDDLVPNSTFITPHYSFSAATWLGSETHGGYEYSGNTYVGRFEHENGVQTCTQCHDPHSLQIRENTINNKAELCAVCHPNVKSFTDYRDINMESIDYDGNGKVEGLFYEIEGLRSILLKSMQQYSIDKLGIGIGWTDTYPYLFIDTNKDGNISQEEAVFANAYKDFTPRIMKAAFNFQFSIKEPAGYVHNGKYVIQLLYDSIKDISTTSGKPVTGLVRPSSDD
jgi:predicted CXXCH cytochrome family protein